MEEISAERKLLLRIAHNEHLAICQSKYLKVTNCLCFEYELKKLLTPPQNELKPVRKDNRQRGKIHWEKYQCGAKNRQTSLHMKEVNCSHCRLSKEFRTLYSEK